MFQLTQIPDSLSECSKVEELNIENNSILKMDQNIFDNLINLQRLVISRNNFKKLPNMKTLLLLYSFNGMTHRLS